MIKAAFDGRSRLSDKKILDPFVLNVDNMNMDKYLLDIIACPICKGKLVYQEQRQELICRIDGLAFPIRDDIPVMLENEARLVPLEDLEKLR